MSFTALPPSAAGPGKPETSASNPAAQARPDPKLAPLAWKKRGACTPGDPYLDWALATEWQGFPKLLAADTPDASTPEDASWVPLIAPTGKALDALLRREQGNLRLNPAAPPDTEWLTLWARRSSVERVRQALPHCELSQPLPVNFAQARPPSPSHASSGTPGQPIPLILGTIDRGGAFLNQVFRAPGRKGACRILSYWDQESLPPRTSGTPWCVAPAGYGRELSQAALQALQKRCKRDPGLEAKLYQQLDMPALLRAAASNQPDHATHVLDTLAGLPATRRNPANAKPDELDAAARAPLVVVSVPESLVGQTTGAACVAQILDALHHILSEAEALAPQAAVVVNISLGALAGPHDGSSALEQAIDDLMRRRPRLLVVFAAGNNGGDLLNDPTSGTNAAGALAPSRSARLTWRLQPGDPTDSFLELWCSSQPSAGKKQAQTQADLQLRVLEPIRSPWLQMGQQLELRQGKRLLGRFHLQVLDGRHGRAQLSFAPVRGERGGVPAGRWLIEMRNAGTQPLNIEARIQGDLPRWTDPAPVQSVLVEAQGLHLGMAGSLNGLATGKLPLMVGAAHTEDDRDSLYTARLKASDDPHRLVRAVADEGPMAYGLIAAGVLSGTESRMGGTSVAAPVAARHWANRLACGGLPPAPEDWLDYLNAGEDGHSSAAKSQQKRSVVATALRPSPFRGSTQA
ncbi:S8 family serine peptidase [Paucibacter sp. Y2R2-4]|uniref:S8 family serine peptidase n=1 Tax=Paucibacter sp. Y2R2-4 TaxID=2893553 RepID=UPI0021E44DEA|nr:S8 family serine peptidase [Paucibacter sp. Y2R2-4]MCV2350578.1 S8 family serine peptidase [Paucibacter sp. Y2R2-4]